MKSRRLFILVCSSLVVIAAYAGPRTSANYSIIAEAIDNGGRHTSSANYTNDGSIGLITGLSSVAVPAETAKQGYIAQLYETTSFSLTAASSTVGEGATDQLAAWQVLDDASISTVPATDVAWNVVSGPLISISTSGLATAGIVYQNSAATARGVFGGFANTLPITVMNVNPDNFSSYGGDGIDDAWQVQYFGQPPNSLAGPRADPDGDGQNNLFEYTAGLNPTNANLIFRLRLEAVPGQPSQKRVIFSPLVAGRSYTVNFRTNLLTGTWTTLTSATQSDAGSERTVTDLSATDVKKFYQIEISKP